MTLNPGGLLAPDEVVGRDRLIRRLWRTLERQSVVLTAERRMGKTSIARKMVSEAPEDWHAVYRDLEGLAHPLELAEATLADLRQRLPRAGRIVERARGLAAGLGGTEVAGVVKLPESKLADWKSTLRQVLGAAGEPTHGERVVLFWDEVPLFIDTVRHRQGATMAMDVLDVLRSLRQELPALRFVFTGSIGFPSIVDELRREGYRNRPTNDMAIVEVEPLSNDDASTLARRCLREERLDDGSVDDVVQALIDATEGIPYYIQGLVHELVGLGRSVAATDVPKALKRQVQHPQDPWDLGHYRKRLDAWSGDARRVALAILDEAAHAEAVATDTLRDAVKSQHPTDDQEIHDVLGRLIADHYVIRDEDGRVSFRLGVLRQWWSFSRRRA